VRHAYEHIDALVSFCGLDGKEVADLHPTTPKCKWCEAAIRRIHAAQKPGQREP
jgi:hypothetical protein